jgi:phage recombination protein Bet
MPPQNTAVQKTTEGNIEFVPFGAADKIKLSIAIVKNFVSIPTKSGQVCGDRDAMRFIMLCQAQRLNPFAGDAYLTGYDGKNGAVFSLITAHVAFMKRAESCKDFEGMESGVIIVDGDGKVTEREGDFHLSDENVVGGWAKVYRKDRKPTYRRLSIAQRKPNYETPFWSDQKCAEQIVKCAEADALRATFPTLLGGLHLGSEVVDVDSIVTQMPAILAAPKEFPQKAVNDAAAESAAGLAPESAKVQVAVGPQAELETLVTEAGFNLDTLLKWGDTSGNIPDGSSIASYAEIPGDVCKRLLRAKTGLLAGLKQISGQ